MRLIRKPPDKAKQHRNSIPFHFLILLGISLTITHLPKERFTCETVLGVIGNEPSIHIQQQLQSQSEDMQLECITETEMVTHSDNVFKLQQFRSMLKGASVCEGEVEL